MITPLARETKLSGTAATGASYPDLSNRSPAAKTPEFIAQYIQAHVSDYMSQGRLDWWGNAELGELLAYAQGNQGTDQYKRHRKDNNRLDPRAKALDYRVLKVIPKYVKSVCGLLNEAEYEAEATPIDSLSKDIRKQFEAALRAQMENGGKLKELGLNLSPNGGPAPLDEDDLDMMLLQYKNKEAARLEGKVNDNLYDFDYAQLAKELNQDNVIFKRSCAVIYTGLKFIEPQRIEPWRLFLLPSRYEDYRDMKAGAYLDEVTIGQIRQEAGDQLSDEQYKQMWEVASTQRQRNGQSWGEFVGNRSLHEAINSVAVSVIRGGFMSVNTDANGVDYWTWYEGNVIVDSNLYYNCRPGYNQLYDMESPGTCKPPFIASAPGLIAGKSSGIVEDMIPTADSLQRKYVKMQDALNRSVPPGYAYDMDRIEEIILAEGNKLTKEQVVEKFERTGRWYHNGVTIDGSPTGNNGLTKLENGISPDVAILYQLIIQDIDLIERITGVNSAVAAGNAQARVSVGGSEIAKEGAVNALDFLFSASQSMFERVCKAMAIYERQKEMLSKGREEGLGKHVFRMKVTRLATKEERQRFEQTITEAVAAGVIDMVDAMLIRTERNTRKATIMLAARAKRKQADAVAQAQEEAKNKAEQDRASQQQAAASTLAAQQQAHANQVELLKIQEEAATKRAVLLARIKTDGEREMAYFNTIAKMHDTALSGAWKGALASIPKPNDANGGATSAATRAATLAALLPAGMAEPPAPPMEAAPVDEIGEVQPPMEEEAVM